MSAAPDRTLSIFGRTFLLMVAALLVAEGMGLALLVNEPAPSGEPVSLLRIARALGRDEVPPQPPGDFDDRDFGGPAPYPDGPRAPREPFGGPGGPPGAPPQELSLPTRIVDAPPAAPSNTDAQASQVLRNRLANLLHTDAASVIVHVPRTDADVADREGEQAALRGDFIAARKVSAHAWRTLERSAGGLSAWKRASIIFAVGLIVLLPLAWLFATALAAPIRRFSQAARGLGTAPYTAPLPVEGPAEMHAAIESFNAMQARIHRLLEERTQMIAAIAHDLRTPLTRLAFRLDDIPAPLHARVNADIEEMRAMIAAALDFIRDRSLNPRRERLDFRLLVESVIDDAADAGRDVTLEPGDPVTIEGDPLALRRAVTNVVDNAVKYGSRARLRLSTGNGRCTLEIDDDGPGIAEALQQRVFEPFFRLESSRSRDTGGVGLGLAFVRSTMIEHGGDVTLCNAARGGLRVTLWLPA